jgi:hypothetical protein
MISEIPLRALDIRVNREFPSARIGAPSKSIVVNQQPGGYR